MTVSVEAAQDSGSFQRIAGQVNYNHAVLLWPRTEWSLSPAARQGPTRLRRVLVGDGPSHSSTPRPRSTLSSTRRPPRTACGPRTCCGASSRPTAAPRSTRSRSPRTPEDRLRLEHQKQLTAAQQKIALLDATIEADRRAAAADRAAPQTQADTLAMGVEEAQRKAAAAEHAVTAGEQQLEDALADGDRRAETRTQQLTAAEKRYGALLAALAGGGFTAVDDEAGQ